jgi:YhcH/YjgK/YiaL family protein
MILDRLEHSVHYARLGDGFAAGFAYLRETDLANLADGRYAIDGENVFAIVQTYSTKLRAEGRWEAHRSHADIQFMVSGTERMGVAPLEGMTVASKYDPETDVAFYRGERTKFFDVWAGEFAMFFPHNVHMPGLVTLSPESVKKVVIKVRLR